MSSHCSYLLHPPGPQRESVALSMRLQRKRRSCLIPVVSTLTIEEGKARYQRNPSAILESRESRMNVTISAQAHVRGGTELAAAQGTRQSWWECRASVPHSGSGRPEEDVLQSPGRLGHVPRLNAFLCDCGQRLCTKGGTRSPEQRCARALLPSTQSWRTGMLSVLHTLVLPVSSPQRLSDPVFRPPLSSAFLCGIQE